MRELQQEKREIMREQQREVRGRRTAEQSKWVKAIEAELKSNGHIKSDGSFKFLLTEDKLKINGKTQSNAEWEKYKGLYETTSSKNLGSDFKIKITTDRNNNKSVTVSVSENSH